MIAGLGSIRSVALSFLNNICICFSLLRTIIIKVDGRFSVYKRTFMPIKCRWIDFLTNFVADVVLCVHIVTSLFDIYIHTINLKIYDSVDIWYLIVDIQWIDWVSSNNVISILIRYPSPCSVNWKFIGDVLYWYHMMCVCIFDIQNLC
jgi:hypothetical protein